MLLEDLLQLPSTILGFLILTTRKRTTTKMTVAAEATDTTIGTTTFFLVGFLHGSEKQSLGFPSTLQQDKDCSGQQMHQKGYR